MDARPDKAWSRLSLARQYMLASLVVIVCCMAGVGWWVSREIRAGVVQETAVTAALYMNSFVAPRIQELSHKDELARANIEELNRIWAETPLGERVKSIKIWGPGGRIVFSTNPGLIGGVFPMSDEGQRAWVGNVVSEISDLNDPEHVIERQIGDRLLEIYSPIRTPNGSDVIAVAEFYQSVDDLEAQLGRVQVLTWLVVAVATALMYAVLAGIVRRGSDTIERQQLDLRDKVKQLTNLLIQNKRLGDRVRRAATETTERNERYLRRVSADLHDGPAQAIGAALLRLDTVIAHSGRCDCDRVTLPQASADLDMIQSSLSDALNEIRAISTGLVLPELENLSLRETVARVVRMHERRTESSVGLTADGLPDRATLPMKITVYRFIQEALANAYRHGEGQRQEVRVAMDNDDLRIEVSDDGPGMDVSITACNDERLGLKGMRQRVESVGGSFHVDSAPGRGTRVSADLPLDMGAAENV